MAPGKKRLFLIGILIAILTIVFVTTHFQPQNTQSSHGGTSRDVPVTVATVKIEDIPIEVSAFGNTESIASITVKPQTDGLIKQVHFKEGQFVQAGQLLFTIDQRPALATLAQSHAIVSRDQAQIAQANAILNKDSENIKQAQAILNKDRAQLNFQQAEEKRYAGLVQNDYVTREQYDQIVTARQTAEAVVASDQAAIATAKAQYSSDYSATHSTNAIMRADQAVVQGNQIQLQYYAVRAPFAGRTGALLVHAGDVVQQNASAMVTVDKLSPVFVTFTVPEEQLVQIQKAQTITPLKTILISPGGQEYTGKLAFSDNTIDQTTGTVRLKAVFENKTTQLWPGQYVQVKLILGLQHNAVIVPLQAIQSGQEGDYVVVIKNNKAVFQPVKVQRNTARYAIIQTGLQANDTVVTDGQMQLEPGTPVKIKESK